MHAAKARARHLSSVGKVHLNSIYFALLCSSLASAPRLARVRLLLLASVLMLTIATRRHARYATEGPATRGFHLKALLRQVTVALLRRTTRSVTVADRGTVGFLPSRQPRRTNRKAYLPFYSMVAFWPFA